MRFKKCERMEPFVWTERKSRIAATKPAREKAKLSKAFPLLADQIEVAPALPEHEEVMFRKKHADDFEKTMRDLDAKHWRHGRSSYFKCDAATRSLIMAEWNAWTGPLGPTNFIYVVEKHNGVAEARRKAMLESEEAIRQRVLKSIAISQPLPF